MAKGHGWHERKGRTGVQREYLEGLDHLRAMCDNSDLELNKVKREFYCCEANVDDFYESYLKQTNDRMLYCNNKLRKNKKLEVVDSELRLVGLLNHIRDLPDTDVDPEIVTYLTVFWEHIKTANEQMLALVSKYRTTVLKKLRSTCGSYLDEGPAPLGATVASDYSQQVDAYKSEIDRLLQGVDALCKSFENSLRQDLFTNTNFSDRILMCCDRKAFPILCLVPDVTEKLSRAVTVSRQWVDRDEMYVHDLTNHIREARDETRKKEEDLRTQKHKKSQLNKSTEEAYKLLETNKSRLTKIESELQTLEEQMVQYVDAKKYKTEEKKQKEGIVSFLDISITQTKKNFTLQLKRSRMMRQLRELEDSLNMIETEIKSMQEEKQEKNEEKTTVKKRVQQSSVSYTTVKTDLDKMQANLELLEKEVEELTGSLTRLETIQTCKTSPERVEDFYDRPTTVKLAPSLKEKILMRKRKLNVKMSSSQY